MSRSPKKPGKKSGRVVKRTLADGSVKEYAYKAYKPKISPRLERDSVASLVLAFKDSPEWRALAPATVQYYSTYLKPLDFIGEDKVSSVTRRNMLEMRDAISSSRGNGAATAFVRSASALFAWAVERNWIPVSPTYKIKRLKGGSLPAWDAEQATIAVSGLPEHYRRAVVLGLYTGQRRGDLCAARWADYDGERLHVIQQKTGAEIYVTANDALRAELDAWRKDATAETIITNKFGEPFSPESLSAHLPRELQKLGIARGLNVHGMRKLFAAGMADAGATTHEIAANTGHKTLAMVQLYTKTADQRKLSEGAVCKVQIYKRGQ